MSTITTSIQYCFKGATQNKGRKKLKKNMYTYKEYIYKDYKNILNCH